MSLLSDRDGRYGGAATVLLGTENTVFDSRDGPDGREKVVLVYTYGDSTVLRNRRYLPSDPIMYDAF